MLSRTFLFGYLFCLFACSSSDLPLVFVSERDVEFDVLDDSVSFGLPIGFCGNARKLYVSDFYGDLLLHEYDLRDKTVERFGYKGKGPGELLPPVLIHMNDTALLAHSKGSFSLGYFPLKDGEKKFTPICRLPTAVSTVILLDRDRILASGFFEQGRYAVLDRAGEEQTYFGTYPDFTERDKKASPAAKAMFHQVSFCARPAGGKVAAVSGYVLDILDCSGDLRVVKRLQLHDYDYRYEDGRVVSAKKPKKRRTAYSLLRLPISIFIRFLSRCPGTVSLVMRYGFSIGTAIRSKNGVRTGGSIA